MANIEVIRFTLRPGISGEVFREVNDRFQEDVAYQSPGMMRRTVATTADGQWVDIRLWSDGSPCEARGAEDVRSQWESMIEVSSRDVYTSL